MLACACSTRRFIPEGQYLLESAKVTKTDPTLDVSQLGGYIHQHPNSKWFSLLKVPMGPYLLQRGDSTKWLNRLWRRIGEAPVIYDSVSAAQTVENLRSAIVGMGYRGAKVELIERAKRHKMSVEYRVDPGRRTYVRDLQYDFPDSAMRSLYFRNIGRSYLKPGIPLDMGTLDNERSRIVSLFQSHGYYRFNRTHIHYLADTTMAEGSAAIRLQITPFQSIDGERKTPHTAYTLDSVDYDDNAKKMLRANVLRNANLLRKGDLYSEQRVTGTYERLTQLGNVVNSTVHFTQSDSSRLNALITLGAAKTHSLQLSPEATNTAGDFGAALSFSYQNRNIFHGGETFMVKLRTAFEAVKGLQGYSGSGYFEYSAETSIMFPTFKFPFLSKRFLEDAQNANTEVSIMFNSQNRPEFHCRLLTGTLRYRWYKYNRRMQHRLDLLDLNYIFMPWISDKFKKDYLDDKTSRNAILRYNYQNIFIMKLGYSYSYTSRPYIRGTNIRRKVSYSIKASIETAGNLLRALSAISNNITHEDGYLHFLGVAYAQYAKGDFEYSRMYLLDDRNSLAFRGYLGIAVPYGNSDVLPYEKRYFSGGANSVRGWSVRSLGPGSFSGSDGRIDFINQTGDIKLDLSVEFRSKLFWKLYGAIFIDAGNIWTLRNYAEQPGGQFRFDTFWSQIAVAYGIGLRLNFDYFVVRLDGGMKAIDPRYSDSRGHYPIIHPKFSRDFALHFAVGLPF